MMRAGGHYHYGITASGAGFRFTRIIALARYSSMTAQNQIIQALYCVNQTLDVKGMLKILAQKIKQTYYYGKLKAQDHGSRCAHAQ